MKVKISFEIEYEEPENKEDYKEIIKLIKNYFENEINIPTTEAVFWKELSEINITDDYKSLENKEE